jgi:uncharacterized integral membrane protein
MNGAHIRFNLLARKRHAISVTLVIVGAAIGGLIAAVMVVCAILLGLI